MRVQERTFFFSSPTRFEIALATLARSASKGHKVGSTMGLRQHQCPSLARRASLPVSPALIPTTNDVAAAENRAHIQ
jgi:hypothetical protein